MISIVYFGTNEFSAQVLETLATTKGFLVKTVVTKPDSPVGRGQEMQKSPVKSIAEKLGLQILQPASLKTFDLGLRTWDLSFVYAYGLLIPKTILDLPKHGTLNIHPSLLPKYRGPTPIQSAIINGDMQTGISLMLLDEGMDHGPIIHQTNVTIGADDTTASLTQKLVTNITAHLASIITDWVDKKITAKPQNHEEATICKIFSREDGKINWSKSAQQIYNLYRGLTPWPGVWTTWQGKRLKLEKIKPHNQTLSNGAMEQWSKLPGTVFTSDNRLFITCGKDIIEATELQLEGKKPMTADVFLNGYKQILGATLI